MTGVTLRKRIGLGCLLFVLAAGPARAAGEGPSVFDAPPAGRRADGPVAFGLDPGLLRGDAPATGIFVGRGWGSEPTETSVSLEDPQKVSVVKAGLLSLLLPGLGELYLGEKTRATVFFVAEGVIWTSTVVFLVQEGNRRDGYEEYARVFAGVQGSHDDEYYKWLGKFMSNEGEGGYNEFVRREARTRFFPDIRAMNDYFDRFAITGTDGWMWESKGRFDNYRRQREAANESERRALYTAAAGIVTRVISVIDVVRVGRGINKQIDQEQASRFSFGVGLDPGAKPEEATVRLSVSRLF